MESYSVEAILSATDKNFTSTMKNADKSMSGLDSNSKKTRTSILDIAKGMGVFSVIQGGINLAKNAVVGLGTELSASSATWKTFTGNMENLGKSKSEIASVKKELQDFATQTIYSASDMATTYSQLEAVGIKSSNKLVKGFGGLAAAAENPKQAMKTLSQQATQMAAKPTVQWMDFKLMLEQTPAGMAAVAKTMGMTTSELVKNVQDGTVKTQDFFDAVTKTGTNDTFGKMATQYKKVSEAVDGLKETLVTKLQPAFDKVSGVGIKAVEGIIGKLEKFNFDKFVSTISSGATKVIDYFKKIWESLKKGLEGFDTTGFKKIFDTIVSIAKVAFGVILAILPTVVEWIGKLATFFSKVITAIQPFLPILLPIIGAWAAFMIQLKGISAVILMFKNLATAIKGIMTTFKILTAIMAANPFVLIVGAIVGLVAAFVYLWKTNEKFRDFWIDVWEMIKKAVGVAVDWITAKWGKLTSWFSKTWDSIKSGANDAFSIIKNVPGKAADQIKSKWSDMKGFFSDIWSGVKENASSTWSSVVEAISPYVSAITDVFQPMITFFSNLWTQIGSMAESAWEIIKTVVMGPILLLTDLITGDFTQLKEDAAMLWQTLSENVMNIVSNFVAIVSGYYTALKDTAINLWNVIASTIKNLWASFTSWLSQTTDNVVNSVKQGWNNLKQGTIDSFNSAVQAGKNAWQSFKDWMKNTVDNIVQGAINGWNNLKQWTINTFNNIVAGAQQAWSNFKQGVMDLVNSARNTFDQLRNINLIDIGRAIMDGFFNGLKSAWGKVKNFVSGIGDWIREHKGPMRVDKKLLMPAGNAIMDGLNAGLNNGFGAVQSNVSSMADRLTTNFDIGGKMAQMNGSIDGVVQHEVSYGSHNKPAVFNVNIGNQQFKAFVDDISQAQGQERDINLSF